MPLIPYTPPYAQFAGVYFDVAAAINTSVGSSIKSGTLTTDANGILLLIFPGDFSFPGVPQILLTPIEPMGGGPVIAVILSQSASAFMCKTMTSTDGQPAGFVGVNWLAFYTAP